MGGKSPKSELAARYIAPPVRLIGIDMTEEALRLRIWSWVIVPLLRFLMESRNWHSHAFEVSRSRFQLLLTAIAVRQRKCQRIFGEH